MWHKWKLLPYLRNWGATGAQAFCKAHASENCTRSLAHSKVKTETDCTRLLKMWLLTTADCKEAHKAMFEDMYKQYKAGTLVLTSDEDLEAAAQAQASDSD